MAGPSGDVSAASKLDHFPLLELPDKALKRVLSYLSLPLRSQIRVCKRLRDMERLAPQHIHSIRIVFCDGNFLLLVVESKSEEERLLRNARERQANGDLEGATMSSILKEDEEDEHDEPLDNSKYSYGIFFNSFERIAMLHDMLKRLAGATIHKFELDTWVSPYFYDDIVFDILPLHRIEHLMFNSTTDQKNLFDTNQIDKGLAVGYECASKNHDYRVLADEFMLGFVFDKDVFQSTILHGDVTAKAIHEVYTVMEEGECSLADFSLFVKVSELREMRKLIGVVATKEGYKTTKENIEMFKTHGDLHFLVGPIGHPIHIHLGSYFAKNTDNYGPVHIERVKNWEEFNEEKEKWDKVQFI